MQKKYGIFSISEGFLKNEEYIDQAMAARRCHELNQLSSMYGFSMPNVKLYSVQKIKDKE